MSSVVCCPLSVVRSEAKPDDCAKEPGELSTNSPPHGTNVQISGFRWSESKSLPAS